MRLIRESAIGLAVLAICVGLLGACGSSGSAQATSTVKSTCQAVSAVLSDGPDPTADPVGYAEAQVLPLRQDVSTTDKALKADIDNLASAYEQFYKTNGSAAAKTSLAQASKKIDSICPGVTS